MVHFSYLKLLEFLRLQLPCCPDLSVLIIRTLPSFLGSYFYVQKLRCAQPPTSLAVSIRSSALGIWLRILSSIHSFTDAET